MDNNFNNIINFKNEQIDPSIINFDQIKYLVHYLLDSIKNGIEGEVVEFGCYVGESTKYLSKTLEETKSEKKLYVYDSFEGLPELSKWEINTGWGSGGLKTTQGVLISNFQKNDLPIPIIHKDWFKDIPEHKIPNKISFAFLDGDFYDSIYDSLNKIFDKVSDGGYICFHDYRRNDLPGVEAAIKDFFSERNIDYTVEEVCEQLGVFKKNGKVKKQVIEKLKITDLFDLSLHHLGKTKKNIKALNIGAMDGVLFDEMIGYSNMYDFEVLYVEPIPYLFDRLKKNITNQSAKFENSAISEYNGEIDMITIEQEAIDKNLVHNCFYGMSAVYPPKNGLGSEFDRPTVEKYGQMLRIPCITFETLLSKHDILNFDIVKLDTEGHDYKIFKQIDLKKYEPKVVRLEWINLSEEEKEKIIDTFEENNYVYEILGQDITGIPYSLYEELTTEKITKSKSGGTTIVTGIWDIKRENLSTGWSRNFDHYLNGLKNLMMSSDNMIIFIEKKYESFIWENRSRYNTLVVIRELEWFKSNHEIFNKIQEIRLNPDWYNQVGWLTESTQAKLEMYNPIVMSKMFLMNDAAILDPFDSSHLVWVDGGITSTVHYGYFVKDEVIKKLPNYLDKFSFVCFPYDANTEIHGFNYNKMNSIVDSTINKVARGGFFGGPKESINEINKIYYNLLVTTLKDGYMGTEESIFTIMTYKYPDLINYFEIESNGLLNTFFENLKNDNLDKKTEKLYNSKLLQNDEIKVGLYVITFNSPKQFETLIHSFIKYDKNYLDKTTKYLLDNSSDNSTYEEYSRLCKQYNFEHIKKDNLGICGGRQWIAEHFDKTNLSHYLFFEDDMFFYPNEGTVCRNGFNRFDSQLFSKTLEIMEKEEFDFLKLNFSEFFGDSSTQWAWYNVPQSVREEFWPEYPKLPQQGLDPNAPKAVYKNILSHKGVPYTKGEVYYSNWPQIVSRPGNKKMFLDTTWAHPFEQTWMSHMYQLVKKGELNPGLLLMTPTEHNRFEHYDGKLRKES